MQGEPGFILPGSVSDGSVSDQGSLGYYWSSTVRNANFAYHLNLDSSYVDPDVNFIKSLGYSVRCVAI